ncbi:MULTISPECIES: VOC family protein [Gammaproteobacteria]|uniref:VOC family protein n=1 Tax=Gammaproteobacteria TaxID=1236 RepID=UPI001911ED43|nr:MULTISPECIES: VOC family protein [Gammaproteobacteria]MBK5304486.1 VOC family protein [Bacillus sp. TH86]MBK5324255.1 VOC family protein [Bacillus sp. TH59]MBK5339205.1 VOC family protein [Bacillus sp. TH57]MBK5313254.1 VOC family protein [Pseudomonas sp. TH71]MBK5318752.1 VOC family protein [Erwinia sp. TH79]
MLSHVFIGITDFDRALAFYQPIMDALQLQMKFCDPGKPWAAWMSKDAPRPLFVIGTAFDEQPAKPGNGQMIALLAPSREIVNRCHALAMVHGGSCEGSPGLRPHYHPDYFGAYMRDPDGNKLCVCCHEPD